MEQKENTSSEEEQQIEYTNTHLKQQRVEPQQYFQNLILEKEEETFKKTNKNFLSEDIEFKLEEILEDIKDDDGKNFESIINLRMKELAYSKILVLTYERSFFRLVMAHFHIGKEYLKFKCYEQAQNHLQIAIDKNIKAADESFNKMYHSYLLSYLGETLYYSQKYDQALKELTRAINLQKQFQKTDKIESNSSRTLKYYALTKSELHHPDALPQFQVALEKTKHFEGERSKVYGLMLYEEGKMKLKLNQIEEAITKYEQAIQVIKMSNQADSEEDIIKIYEQLANLHEPRNKQKYLQTLKQKYQVFEDSFGNSDKRSIKEQRNLVTALLKCNKIEEALEESQDIWDKEKKVYGENSLEVGKQLRTIGNIYNAMHDTKQAEIHFTKSLKIFQDLGDQKLARQVRVKITSLQARQQ